MHNWGHRSGVGHSLIANLRGECRMMIADSVAMQHFRCPCKSESPNCSLFHQTVSNVVVLITAHQKGYHPLQKNSWRMGVRLPFHYLTQDFSPCAASSQVGFQQLHKVFSFCSIYGSNNFCLLSVMNSWWSLCSNNEDEISWTEYVGTFPSPDQTGRMIAAGNIT